MPTLLDVLDLTKLLGLGRQSVYNLTAEPDFPAVYTISSKSLRWSEAEVLAWLESKRGRTQIKKPRAQRRKHQSVLVNGVSFKSPR